MNKYYKIQSLFLSLELLSQHVISTALRVIQSKNREIDEEGDQSVRCIDENLPT
jgi:hypothetical protein